MTETPPTLWERFKKYVSDAGKLISANVLAPLATFVVVCVAFILVTMGFKEIQIGGLIAKMLGRKTAEDGPTDLANSVPSDRIGPDGKLIPPGTADTKGQTQAVVVPIEEPGLFSNPNEISFVPPGEEDSQEIALPDGVKNKDVDQVVVVQPEIVAVTVKDSSGIQAEEIDDLLKKYEELCAH